MIGKMTEKERKEYHKKRAAIIKSEPIPPKLQIYTTGAFCEPVKMRDPVTGKFAYWAWMVVSFEDNSYEGGDELDMETGAVYVNPVEFPKTENHFICPEDGDMDDYMNKFDD